MKASVVCLLFASLLVIVLPRGNEGNTPENDVEQEELEFFKDLDADNNGCISLDELRIKLPEYRFPVTAEEFMEVFDANNDNQITFEELQDDSFPSDEEDDK